MADNSRLPYPISGIPEYPPAGGGGIGVFDSPDAIAINRARMAHLDSLHLPIGGKSVLDVGCGVGHLSRFFVERGCQVTCVDGRPENIAVLRSHYPNMNAHVADVQTDPLTAFGLFDIVFCYGLLYHLENPVAGLRNIAQVCNELLLLETVVTDHPEPIMRLLDEPVETHNQALRGMACRPSPAFVAMALNRAGFGYVYAPKYPPDHPDFRFAWENNLEFSRANHLLRCVFVASHNPLDNPTLLPLLGRPANNCSPQVLSAPDSIHAPRVWLDVGAHLGEKTFAAAQSDPNLRVYAFEPNLEVAAQKMGLLPNFIMLPMAVAEHDGSADFHLNSFDAASSLLPLDPDGLKEWIGGAELQERTSCPVPTIRLDTFLNSASIPEVEFLKIDAQGADLAVVRSLGARLKDIQTITLEVQITPLPVYRGAAGKEAVLCFMEQAGFRLIAAERQSHDQEENLTFERIETTGSTENRALASTAGQKTVPIAFSPASAYWNQRVTLANARDRILSLRQAVDQPSDLLPYQWGQLIAAAVEYEPDVILQLGRGTGNATCAFTEACNLRDGRSRVLSVCSSDDWERQTLPRLRRILPDNWFAPLEVKRADILKFDYRTALAGAKRVLIFWDAHGFDIAECVLGSILPIVAEVEHLVIMHDLSDARYNSEEQLRYAGHGLWKANGASGPRVKLGLIDSAVEQSVAALDFTTRNRLTLDSADHSFRTRLTPAQQAEMRNKLGELFDLQGHWFYFTLNEGPGPYTFPRYTPP
jgi:FkbM family methyltransferase